MVTQTTPGGWGAGASGAVSVVGVVRQHVVVVVRGWLWWRWNSDQDAEPVGLHVRNGRRSDAARCGRHADLHAGSDLPRWQPQTEGHTALPRWAIHSNYQQRCLPTGGTSTPSTLSVWQHSPGVATCLAFATLPLPIPSVALLKPTASSRLLAPPSGSPKCLRFGLWLTLCTLNIDLLTYLLTYLSKNATVILRYVFRWLLTEGGWGHWGGWERAWGYTSRGPWRPTAGSGAASVHGRQKALEELTDTDRHTMPPLYDDTRGDPSCACGSEQTMSHIINECPLTKHPGGLSAGLSLTLTLCALQIYLLTYLLIPLCCLPA